MNNIKVDVLIIGSGVAGLYSALSLNRNLDVLVITKSKAESSNSYLAQGGIAVARDEKDIPLHIQDTLKAGQYRNDPEAVKILVEESRANLDRLIELGIKLDTIDGELAYTREAAHSCYRIVHSKDETGKAVINTLIHEMKERKNITMFEDTYLVDIIEKDNICTGAIAVKDGEQLNIHSKVVILATGGIGGIFKNSTNQRHITADGIAIALKHNISVKNLQYIQFHPTAFYENTENKRRFLISESVRGEGGRLINNKGERFVDELLPRDVVTEAILKEMLKSSIKHVYLDITHLPSVYIVERFPAIYNECRNRGLDITREPIPVAPAQHYFMGGIDVDYNSRTSMTNLFAIGEVSCTGVHGANRLASNSLLEGLVFAKRASNIINLEISNIKLTHTEVPKLNLNLQVLQKKNLKLASETFKRKAGKYRNELVQN